MNCEHEEIIMFPDNISNIGDGIRIKDIDNCLVFCKNCNKSIANEDIYLYPASKRFVGVPKEMFE